MGHSADENEFPAGRRRTILRSGLVSYVSALCFSSCRRASASEPFIAAAFVGLVLIAFVVIFELRKTPKQEAEMIKREDKVMSEVRDDPNEPARWVP